MRHSHEITEVMYNVIVNVVSARTVLFMYNVEDRVKVSREECDRFVCSFSKNKDALAMWNYYSRKEIYKEDEIMFAILKEL